MWFWITVAVATVVGIVVGGSTPHPRWWVKWGVGAVAALLTYYLLNLFAGWILGLAAQIPFVGPKIAEWAQQPAPAITMPALPKVPGPSATAPGIPGPAATAPAAPAATPATTPRPGEKVAEPEVTDRIVVSAYDNARSGAQIGGRIYVEVFAPDKEQPIDRTDQAVDPQWGATLKPVLRGAIYRIVFYTTDKKNPLGRKTVYFSGGVKALIEKDGIWVTSNALVPQIETSEAGGETNAQ